MHFTTPFLVVSTEPVTFLGSHLPLAMAITAIMAVAANSLPIVKLLASGPNAILANQ